MGLRKWWNKEVKPVLRDAENQGERLAKNVGRMADDVELAIEKLGKTGSRAFRDANQAVEKVARALEEHGIPLPPIAVGVGVGTDGSHPNVYLQLPGSGHPGATIPIGGSQGGTPSAVSIITRIDVEIETDLGLLPKELKVGERWPPKGHGTWDESISPLSYVTRDSPEFSKFVFVPSHGNLRFKNEELRKPDHMIADNFMRPELSVCLLTLANLASKEWPDVKLEVTESWDDTLEHRPGSLHYDGRALDIVTSPRDPAKYGRIARLAVAAGCDRVLNEGPPARPHVHIEVDRDLP